MTSAGLLPEGVVVEAGPEGPFRRVVLGRPDADAHRALLADYTAAGQFVLVAPPDGREATYFSMARAPGEDTSGLELLIKNEGDIGELLCRARAGDRVTMSNPIGEGYALGRARGGDVLLLAAGTGIAPVRAALEVLLRDRQDYGWLRLYYGQASPDHFAYRNWLATLPSRGVEVVLVSSQPSIDHRGPMGYVQVVADTGDNFARPESLHVIYCGMEAMEQETRERATARGLKPEQLLHNL